MGYLLFWALDVDGPFPGGSAFDQGGAEDGINFLILMAWLSGYGTSGILLHLGLQGLPGVEDKFLEIAPIHHFLELSSKRMAVHGTMTHTIMESTTLPSS